MSSFSETLMSARRRKTVRMSGKRFKEILSIIRKHDITHGFPPEKAVALLEDLGATFVKLGQIASNHPDMLPKEYCDAFCKLRTEVTPMDFPAVRSVVESELDSPLEELFSEFDEHAVGSASIAQVHRAVLKDDGSVVAVKVQRPEVAETVAEDLAILESIVDFYDLVVPQQNQISLKELLEELARTSCDELDFTVEARNIETFHENNVSRDNVRSPRLFERFCTSKILVEEYFDSPSVHDGDWLETLGAARRKQVAERIAENFLQQVLEDGFYHADPHAANILVTPSYRIEWIDFGMMGTLTSAQRERVRTIIKALLRGDAYALQRGLTKVITPIGPVDHGHLIDICESIIEEFVNVDLEEFQISGLINTLIDSVSDCGYQIDSFLVTLARALVTLEGTLKIVSEQLNIMQAIEDYSRKGLDADMVFKKAQRLVSDGVDSAEATIKLPTKLVDLLDMLQKGQVKMSMTMDMDRSLVKDFVDALSYFAFALLAAAMIVGSCILCTTELQPQVLGIPAIGLAGFFFGVALMLYITYRIFHDRLRRKHRKQ